MPPMLSLNATHDILQISSSNLPLDIRETVESFGPHAQARIESGIFIYMYSDSITEAASVGQELYVQARLEALVSCIHWEQLPLEVIWQEPDTYCGGEKLSDDAVMVEDLPWQLARILTTVKNRMTTICRRFQPFTSDRYQATRTRISN